MNFNSSTFALFLLVVGTLYAILQLRRNLRAQNMVLLSASYVFYATWDVRLLFLILLSTVLDYTCGLSINGHVFTSRASIKKFAILLVGATVLCTPIDTIELYGRHLPESSLSGGWRAVGVSEANVTNDQDWLPFWLSLASTLLLLLGFEFGKRLTGQRRSKYFLCVSVCGNLGLLAFFKYFDFFVGSASQALSSAGLTIPDWQLGIVVPVGISFYTFQTLSYTIDIYRGELKPTRNFTNFALFVAFFPQLVAGPIERARILLPQLETLRQIRAPAIRAGCYLVGWGVFKKIYIADNLAAIVDANYNNYQLISGPAVLFATYGFAFQIYADFSAYSDIARGVSRCLGIELMVNFNVPYVARSPSEFWRRWHISLSTWLRDYLYIPLGGNRGGPAFMYRNLMITMLLGGLWHGARMNFVLWGLYQGLLLSAYRLIEPHCILAPERSTTTRLARKSISWLLFFHLMCFGWLLFRAETAEQIVTMSQSLCCGWSGVSDQLGIFARLVWYCWPLLLVQFFQVRTGNLLAPMAWPWPVRALFYLLLFYLTVIFGSYDEVEFIYFQF